MPKPVHLSSMSFRSKREAEKFIRTIRDRYRDGQRLSPEDESCVREFIAIHPDAEAKIGCGIAYITVVTDAEFNKTRHFMIHRDDASSTDVSFHHAIHGANDRRDRIEALRRAIAPQIQDFRTAAFAAGDQITCPLRGVPVTPERYHVDHEPPLTFDRLKDDWLAAMKIKIEDVAITPSADNQLFREMTDEPQKQNWREFHARNAKLRMLSSRANLSDAKVEARA